MRAEQAFGEIPKIPIIRDAVFTEWRFVAWLMFCIDIVAVETSLGLGYLARDAASVWWPIEFTSTGGLIEGMLVLPVSFALVGLYPGYGLGGVERLRRRLSITVYVFMILFAWDSIALSGAWSRGVMLASFCFAIIITPLCEVVTRLYLIRRRLWGAPIYLVGAGEAGAKVARNLKADPQLGFVPVGFLSTDPEGHEMIVEGLPVLGPVADAMKHKGRVETVILTIVKSGKNGLANVIQNLPFSRIVVVPDLFDLPNMWVTSRDIGGNLALEFRRNLLVRHNRIIKRVSDYVLAVPLFIASLPVIAVAAICIKIGSPGPIFFRQEREGFNGRKFHMWKLRTMYLDAEARMETLFDEQPAMRREWACQAKLDYDPRIT